MRIAASARIFCFIEQTEMKHNTSEYGAFMKMILVALMTFATSAAFANQTPCQSKISSAVRATAKALGLKQNFGFEVNEGEDLGKKDIEGRPLISYSTSVFIIDEGYLSGTGASAVVRPKGNSCEIVQLTISLRN